MHRWESIDPLELSGRSSSFERPMSRRQALRTGAVAVGAVAGLSLADAVPALASRGSQPRPIPGGFDQNFNLVPKDPFIHVLPPAYGLEMSTITDFHGVVVAGEVQGVAHGSNGAVRSFDCDMRFMRGRYVSLDGRHRDGLFGFI
jgi:hypothetical protein